MEECIMINLINLFDQRNWEEAENYPEGTLKKTLRDDNGDRTILLKLPKGFKMESHSHITTEQHFVLKGEYISEDHGPFRSKNGALVLVIWDPYNSDD